jgi:ABC-type Fe3+-hydroxamate transport system substrate-binding protein
MKVGGTKDPQVEQIAALVPDLVLMNGEENRREDYQALKGQGLTCHSTMPRTIQETAEMVRSIGAVLACVERAEEIAIEIERRAEAAQAAASEREPVSFAYLIWRDPLMSVNQDTFASDLLSNAGGVNVFAGKDERYPEVRMEELRAASPDKIFLCTEPYPFKSKDAVDLSVELDLPLEQIYIADGEYLSWHGSRTPAGIDYAASLIG